MESREHSTESRRDTHLVPLMAAVRAVAMPRRAMIPLLLQCSVAMRIQGAIRMQTGYGGGGNRGGGRAGGGWSRGGRGGGGAYREKDDSGRWREERVRRSASEPSLDALPDGYDNLYGVTPVLSALRSQRRSFHKLFLQDSLSNDQRSDRPALTEIQRLADELSIKVELRDKGSLNGMCMNRPHQGLVLQASQLDFVPMQALPPVEAATDGSGRRAPLWLSLDEVTDPQNLGALLRSSLFLGVDGVLVSAKNSCPLTPAVSKASAGAMEVMTVHAARNLPRTLEAAKEAGWQVAGAALKDSVEPEALAPTEPTILVLGSEGHGLRTNVLRACSALVRIPRGESAAAAGDAMDVDSLNVSVAGGILLYSLLNARKVRGS